MTIETLEQHRKLISEIKSMDAVINALYDTRKSPNGKDPGGHGSGPSAPTEQAVDSILELKEKQKRTRKEWERGVQEIETWLNTVTDADIRSIVRLRYVLGYSWKRTSREIYGTDSYYRASKKFYRFMEKN